MRTGKVMSVEVSMGDDDLNTVVREGVEGLRQYIRLLESLLASARAAESLFPGVLSSIERDSRENSLADQVRGLGPVNSPAPAFSEYGRTYARLESALLAERPSGHNRVLKGLRVIAAAGGGELDFGMACQVLRHTGVCRGTPENVSSYVSRRLRVSDEFQRVGEPGSGRYKWLLFQGERSEDVPDSDSVADDCGNSDPQDTVESPSL